MDERAQIESETQQIELESSGRTDAASAENKVEQNTASSENHETESEPIGAEMKATVDHAIDNSEKTAPPDEAPEDAEKESEGPNEKTERGHETLPPDSSEGDNIGAFEKEAQSSTEALDDGGEDEDKETQGSSDEKVAIEKIDEKQENEGDVADDEPAVQAQIESETTDAEEKNNDIAEEKTAESPARKNSALKVAISTILIAAAFSGFFIFDNKAKVKMTTPSALNTSEKLKISPDRHKKPEISKPVTSKINSIYSVKIEEITALRDRLLLKQQEVLDLKKRYQDGVKELEYEISDELQKGESNTFLQAIENNAIAFTLRTIQRRQSYVQQLEAPLKWIHQGCEELLYIKRRTMVDLQVAEIAGGIDMNKHVRHINAALQKYQPTADKLAPDMTAAKPESLETIWNRIQDKTQLYASARAHSQNQIISEQICTGDFNRLSELSKISAETARCISGMEASDLFLNGLTEISPAAAKQLFQWKGSWVCLNGVRAISPRTAHYLFQWDGNWISLNGLTEFPAEIGESLLQWDGHQLELMGLQYAEDFPKKIALEYLARWEQGGRKLFVPQEIRKKMEELR